MSETKIEFSNDGKGKYDSAEAKFGLPTLSGPDYVVVGGWFHAWGADRDEAAEAILGALRAARDAIDAQIATLAAPPGGAAPIPADPDLDAMTRDELAARHADLCGVLDVVGAEDSSDPLCVAIRDVEVRLGPLRYGDLDDESLNATASSRRAAYNALGWSESDENLRGEIRMLEAEMKRRADATQAQT